MIVNSDPGWGVHTSKSYTTAAVEEDLLALHLITRVHPDRREFYILDIGAGSFAWINNMEKLINAGLPMERDVKVHLIGIRGEECPEIESTEVKGKCVIHRLCGFKIENLETEFEKLESLPNIKGEIDLIYSNWTLRHLVDPLGTFQQAYNHLRVGGLFFFDGFFYFFDKPIYLNENAAMKMLFLLETIGSPYLFRRNFSMRKINDHVIQKSSEKEIAIPFSYRGLKSVFYSQVASERAVIFNSGLEPGQMTIREEFTLNQQCMGGSQALFNYFKDNDLFDKYYGIVRYCQLFE